jgi:protein-tyrosine phosphatase
MLVNFRDIGYIDDFKKIKKGILYRSAHIDSLKGIHLKDFEALGIKTIIDLRNKNEKKKPVVLNNTKTVSIPLGFDGRLERQVRRIILSKKAEREVLQKITEEYRNLVRLEKQNVGMIFDILSDENNYPVMINCRAGKDRTGFIIALILLTLGIDKAMIVEDYLLTNKHFLPQAAKIIKRFKIFTLGLFFYGNLYNLLTAHSENMTAIFDTITDDYGNVFNYLTECNVTTDQMEKLKIILLK